MILRLLFGTFQQEKWCRLSCTLTLALLVPLSGSLSCLAQAMGSLLDAPMAVSIFMCVMTLWFVMYIFTIHKWSIIIVQLQYTYLIQENLHDGPVLDLKFEPHFGWLTSVDGHPGHSCPQVSQIMAANGSKWWFWVIPLIIFIFRSAADNSFSCAFQMHWHQCSHFRWWCQFTHLHLGNPSDVRIFYFTIHIIAIFKIVGTATTSPLFGLKTSNNCFSLISTQIP